MSDETGLHYTSQAVFVEVEGPEVVWYWQPASPEALAVSVRTLPETLVHRHLMTLAERAYPVLHGDTGQFSPADHPADWFTALLRDLFRRQQNGSG